MGSATATESRFSGGGGGEREGDPQYGCLDKKTSGCKTPPFLILEKALSLLMYDSKHLLGFLVILVL